MAIVGNPSWLPNSDMHFARDSVLWAWTALAQVSETTSIALRRSEFLWSNHFPEKKNIQDLLYLDRKRKLACLNLCIIMDEPWQTYICQCGRETAWIWPYRCGCDNDLEDSGMLMNMGETDSREVWDCRRNRNCLAMLKIFHNPSRYFLIFCNFCLRYKRLRIWSDTTLDLWHGMSDPRRKSDMLQQASIGNTPPCCAL